MNVWKRASTIFIGGTEKIKSLSGKRVKVIANLSSVRLYDPFNNFQKNVNLKIGMIGFISNPYPKALDELLIVYPTIPNKIYRDLNTLTRSGGFFVVQINSPTFKRQFDIEI